MTADSRATVALGTTLALWASAFVFIRVALPGFGVAGLSAGRLLVASVALAAAAPLLRVRRPERGDLARIAACGLTGMTAYQLLLNAGERTIEAGTASLLVNTGPIFAALLAFALLREPLTSRSWAGIGLGCTGATVMALAQGNHLRPSADALLILGAALAQALFFVLQKPLLARYRPFEVTCYATWSGTLFALPLLPDLAGDLPHAGPDALAALIFLGAAPSAIGFAAWAYAQARVPVAVAANTLYLVPLLAIGIGWALLAETVHPGALAGGLLALAGVALSRGRPRPTAVAGYPPREPSEKRRGSSWPARHSAPCSPPSSPRSTRT
ncbi:DMT family transporter [Amycolatopsis anabasis]|uniref:DMT family transporter n=1 Tax=Amycolatopsis anabasis TaxID=1840409 RepID=UPI00131A624B|nr:DMT family transporter [Amycolatopsis anabasis]